MRDLIEIATISTAAMVLFTCICAVGEYYSDSYFSWECSPEEKKRLDKTILEVHGYMRDIKCLQIRHINHPELFGPELRSLMNKTIEIFDQARTLKKANKMTQTRINAINRGIEQIQEKLKAYQVVDKELESRLLNVPKGKCLIISRTFYGMHYQLQNSSAQPLNKHCLPKQDHTRLRCTLSYDTKDDAPLFLPTGATPDNQLTWAGNRIQ